MKSRTIRRQAFTLVELMIVIAIIGLLLAMLTAGIWMAIKKGKQTRNRVDITQLEVALEQFKQRFGDYPPSRIKLCESYAYYDLSTNAAGQPNNQLDYDSVQFLTKMFLRLDISSWSS